MELQRTQMDNLQWEVNRLDAENMRLREQNPDASNRMDCETELKKATEDVAELNGRVQVYEQRLAESAQAAEDAERRAVEAEARSRELAAEVRARAETEPLSREKDEESAAGRSREELESERAELERAYQTSERNVATMEDEVGRLRRELLEHERRAAAEREAVLQQMELRRYCAVEEERRKWEERESRWCDKITGVEEELRAALRPNVNNDSLLELERLLESTTSKLRSTEAMLSGLSEENEQLKRENHTLIEQNTELELDRTRSGWQTEERAIEPVSLGGLRSVSGPQSPRVPPSSDMTRPAPTPVPVPTCQYVEPSYTAAGVVTSTIDTVCTTTPTSWLPWIPCGMAGPSVSTRGGVPFSLTTIPTLVGLSDGPRMSSRVVSRPGTGHDPDVSRD